MFLRRAVPSHVQFVQWLPGSAIQTDRFSLTPDTGSAAGGSARGARWSPVGLAPALRVALSCLTFGLAAEHGTAAAGAGCC